MKLADWLTSNAVTDADFARRIDVSRQALGRYKANERFPKPEILSRIHNATKGAVTANDFVPLVKKQVAA